MHRGHPGRTLSILCILLAGLMFPRMVQAQEPLEVEDARVVYTFGREITFHARLLPAGEIAQASVLFRQAEEQVTHMEALTLEPDGSAHFTYDASLNLFGPFSEIAYWFQAAFTDGSTRTSPAFSFRYEDNRFSWQQVSEGNLTVHWYDGDAAFGQAALDAARAGVESIGSLLVPSSDAPLDVYVYSTADDLQGALYLGGRDWIGGHADPALGVALAAVPPDETQSIALQTLIPHEAAHVLLYRELGAGYGNLPTWLSEGIAAMAETYPNPDYANALELAGANGSLIPVRELCDTFPPDSGRAFLAYAESQSFTAFLRDNYGSTGLAALMRAYADGLDCDLGAARAMGMPLNQLEARWRETALGQNLTGAALRDLAPYLIVMALALAIPLGGAAKMAAERRKYEHQAG